MQTPGSGDVEAVVVCAACARRDFDSAADAALGLYSSEMLFFPSGGHKDGGAGREDFALERTFVISAETFAAHLVATS